MCALLGGWAVPDFGTVADRPRLSALISADGTRPCIVFGGSGCGKSVAVAGYVSGMGIPTIWIDAAGESMSASQIAEQLVRTLKGERPAQQGSTSELADLLEAMTEVLVCSDLAGDGCCVVVDDLGDRSAYDRCSGLSLLARALRSCGSRLIITSRSVDSWSTEHLCNFSLIGPDQVRLTKAEAIAVQATGGFRVSAAESEALRVACNGHAALFRLLLLQSHEHGIVPSAERVASLDAWIGHIMGSILDGPDAGILTAAIQLKNGTSDELSCLCDTLEAGEAVTRIAAMLPLVNAAPGGSTFRIHDLVDGYYDDNCAIHRRRCSHDTVERAAGLLALRGDHSRACELLRRLGNPETSLRWLDSNGVAALMSGNSARLGELLDSVPIGQLMGHPRLLLLWADVCSETGNLEDAYSKSRAGRALAMHEGDQDTTLRAMTRGAFYLRQLGRLDEADAISAEVLAMPQSRVPDRYRAESMFCIGHNHLLRGDADKARGPLEVSANLASSKTGDPHLGLAARHALAMIPALYSGDFGITLRLLTPMFQAQGQLPSTQLMVKGNAAICLAELGRLTRGQSLARTVVRETQRLGMAMYTGAYMPTVGCIESAQGEIEHGIQSMREAVRLSVSSLDEAGADQARVYLAVILRAAGRLDESLTEAERAFERLSVNDTMCFRRLAALEVAASLLALGDTSAARAWTESITMEGFSGNLYHALRADMILAEVDRREGRPSDAVARLAEHRDYIVSENPNWQVAMYCRSFPSLLGMVAAAIAPEPVPAHLLRMILPEHAEKCLGAARSALDDAHWRDLGVRLIGKDEFSAYLQRDGLPLCHVRLFGGLELSIGGRAVRERDWKKRKARLLFAMLAIRRGQDVPRDQLFEYLWPEMDAERAKNHLYVVWSTMKAALVGEADKGAPCPYIESAGGVCRTVRDAVRTDVDEFETLLAVAREAEAAEQPSAALRAYERVADLYRGDLLPGDVYDDWFATLRDHYRSSFVDAMLRATALLTNADDPGSALIYVRKAIQCDPYREDLFQAALRCQIAAGQRSSAIDTYFQCRDNLAEELGLDPSVETRALYDQILAMEDSPRPMPLDPLI